MAVDSPTDRKQSFLRRIVAARQSADSAVFAAEGVTIEYEERTFRLEIIPEERDRLENLLEAYHVFKIEEPKTRKAENGVVYLSAVTDPKHAADFVEALFRDVYELDQAYELRSE